MIQAHEGELSAPGELYIYLASKLSCSYIDFYFGYLPIKIYLSTDYVRTRILTPRKQPECPRSIPVAFALWGGAEIQTSRSGERERSNHREEKPRSWCHHCPNRSLDFIASNEEHTKKFKRGYLQFVQRCFSYLRAIRPWEAYFYGY
jgi:hypothetical protein